MSLRHKINTYTVRLRKLPKKYYLLCGVVFVASLYVLAFQQRTLAYNYGGETCDQRLVVFPGLFRQASGNETYEITTKGGRSVFGQQITATSICVSPVKAPSENSSEAIAFAPWAGWLARLSYKIETAEYPKVDTSTIEKEPIPASRQLVLPLSQPDTTFSYSVTAEEKQAECESIGDDLNCDLPALQLKQGSQYTLALEKRFKDQELGKAADATIKTLSPLSIIEASIKNDTTVYDKPASITITADKILKRADFTMQRIDGDEPVDLTASTSVEGDKVVIAFADELPRQARIALKATAFEAIDGSTPLDPYSLVFTTSGGPKVTGVNVGSSGLAIGSQIVVTFDQELSADQDIGSLIGLSGGVAYQARQGNQLIFSTANVGLCQNISITLKPDITSPYGISGQSAWQYSGRMRCYTVTTIGSSVQGRAINAYHFGSNGPAIVYTGAIHGSEASTKYLMDRWISELDANPGQIPTNKRVIVVPTINPDGLAAGTRVNARNIDLNRNFATGDWQKDIQHTNGSSFPGGGGEAPMSEPETKAIASLIAQQRPELVISYHSIGWLVISNQAGQAGARASQYASMSGYQLSPGGGDEFGYQITGTADDYYREKLGVPSIIIELGSHSYHQFEKNRTAMWAMVKS